MAVFDPFAKPLKVGTQPSAPPGFFPGSTNPQQVAPIGGPQTDSIGVAPPPMPIGQAMSPLAGGYGQNTGINGQNFPGAPPPPDKVASSKPSMMTDPATDPGMAPSPGLNLNDYVANLGRTGQLADPNIDAATGQGTPGPMGVRPPPFNMAAGAMPGAMTGPTATNPGVSIGGQQAWNGGPTVSTTRVGYDQLPDLQTDFGDAAARGAEASYRGASQFFDEDFGKDRAAREAQLQSMGFAVGSQAYNNELDRMERQQNAARTNAGFTAQGVGHQQAGDLLARALQSRAALVGERSADADRTYGQSLGIANLGLGARGQDKGVEQAGISAAASANAANAAAESNRYSTDASTNVALRRLGLDQGNQDFNQLVQLMTGARGGVNMPNFGTPTPVDVGGANSIASNNANASAARTASDRAALAQLGAGALGSIPWGTIFGGG